jgi:hypothetical protein
LFLQIVSGRLAAWNNGDQPDYIPPLLMGNDVDVLLHNNEEELLSGIARLIGMIRDPPEIPEPEMDDNILKGDTSGGFEEFILLGIPFKTHPFKGCLIGTRFSRGIPGEFNDPLLLYGASLHFQRGAE